MHSCHFSIFKKHFFDILSIFCGCLVSIYRKMLNHTLASAYMGQKIGSKARHLTQENAQAHSRD